MAYNGQLRSNEIFSAIYNMIISQQVEARNIAQTFSELVDGSRVDGSLFGDTKLYYTTDCLKSAPWGNDAEATNLLALHRPPAPNCQAVTLDVFRQISLTVDNYLSKRAFADEGSFSAFNSVMLGWIKETKRIYDATTYNTFIGTDVSTATIHEVDVDESEYPSLGQGIGNVMADLIIALKDISRDYNELGYLRSYAPEQLEVVFNSVYVNQVKNIDLPALFHGEEVSKMITMGKVLPARYFGTVNTVAKTTADAKTRSLIEQDVGAKHYFAGDLIELGTALVSGGAIVVPSYQEDADIIAKVTVKGAVPYMSAFEVGTSFYNPKSLTENHYLTFGHNTLVHLADKPMIVVKKI